MKVLIVKQDTKLGERYYGFRSGFLSTFGIFCLFNRIGFSGGRTAEQCIKSVKSDLIPDPPKNSQVIRTINI